MGFQETWCLLHCKFLAPAVVLACYTLVGKAVVSECHDMENTSRGKVNGHDGNLGVCIPM